MRERIKNLSPRGEFFLIITICFAYFIGSSLTLLLLRRHTFELTPGRLVRGITTELAILAAAGWVLHVRGWRMSRLSGPFSWQAALAGVPLFVGYIALFWITTIVATSIYPPAARLTGVRLTPRAPFLLFAAFIVLNSVFEELTVSAYVVTALSEQGAALSITASALLRFLYHLYQGPIASLAVLPNGFLFAGVYWRWKNLWPLMVAHTIANFVVLLVAQRSA